MSRCDRNRSHRGGRRCDRSAAMQSLFDRFGTGYRHWRESIWRPLRAAQLLSEMTDDDVTTHVSSQVGRLGCCTERSLKSPVRHFVCSLRCQVCWVLDRLAHYTATSAFLDGFAGARRTMGLPATVVDWGLWKSLADVPKDATPNRRGIRAATHG